MYSFEPPDRLDLHDDRAFDDQIEPVTAVDSLVFIDDRQGLLPLEAKSTVQKFKRQTRLVRIF